MKNSIKMNEKNELVIYGDKFFTISAIVLICAIALVMGFTLFYVGSILDFCAGAI